MVDGVPDDVFVGEFEEVCVLEPVGVCEALWLEDKDVLPDEVGVVVPDKDREVLGEEEGLGDCVRLELGDCELL